MSIVLRAKLRKWQDSDIEGAVKRLQLQQGEMSFLVRRGFRMALVERGVLETIDDIETAIERREVE
jgi:hypothetical protein